MSNPIVPALILAAVSLIPAWAQEAPRPVLQQYRLEAGAGSALSTYLSPLRYSGTSISLSGQWSKSSQWNPENLIMQFEGRGNLRDMRNPAHTAMMIGIDGMFSWGMSWRKRLPLGFQITAGGSVALNGGCLYLTRNGNNPVTVTASGGFDINASLSWKFKIGKLPAVISDELRLPTISAFFSPEYGETYYEIYLGNRKGLAHCGWWGNHFGIDNLLSLKLDFGRTAMEIGYRYDISTSHANHLDTRVQAHRFVIGVIPHGLGIRRRETINSSLY